MAFITYKGKIFEYDAEELDIHTSPEISFADAQDVLFSTQDILSKLGITINLCFGTLLGAVRDKNFIKGDYDVDVFAKNEYKLISLLWEMKRNGLNLIRVLPHKVYSFRLASNPSCYIDIYIMRKTKSIWGLYCYELNGLMIPKKLLKNGEISFLGRTFACPAHPENLLRFWYTDTWKIPIGKFNKKYKYEVSSHYYYIHIKDFVKRNLRKILLKLS